MSNTGVVTTAVIDAPLDAVWNLISDFAGLKRWHPLVQRCETEGNGEGAVRTVHFADWWLIERLERLDHVAHIVSYSVIGGSRPPMIGLKGTISLTADGPHRTRLLWTRLGSGKPPNGATGGHPVQPPKGKTGAAIRRKPHQIRPGAVRCHPVPRGATDGGQGSWWVSQSSKLLTGLTVRGGFDSHSLRHACFIVGAAVVAS
jgi:Polyketide cyclase / dehydrase and lipid transport